MYILKMAAVSMAAVILYLRQKFKVFTASTIPDLLLPKSTDLYLINSNILISGVDLVSVKPFD